MSRWGEDICEGPVEGISVEIVAADFVNVVLCCCMMAVPSSFCNGSSPAVCVGHYGCR